MLAFQIRYCKKNSILNGVLYSLLAVILTSCQRPALTKSTINIQLPAISAPSAIQTATALQKKQSSIAAASSEPTWSDVIPETLDDIGCYAIFVGGPEAELNANYCQNTSSTELMRFGTLAGLKPAGSTLNIEVDSGPSRRIYLVGLQLLQGTCENMQGADPTLTWQNYSSPYLLGSKTVDLSAGEQSVAINLSANFTDTYKINKCSFIKAVAPPTLTSPTSLTFDNPTMPSSVPFGTQPLIVFTLNNSSTTDNAIALSPIVTGPFAIYSQTCSTTLAPGGSCTYTIRYKPTTIASDTGSLTLNYTFNGQANTLTQNLTGNAVVGTIIVDPVYASFANWNDYVRGDGVTACDGTETSLSACIHGAEKKVILAPGLSTCAGVTALDSEGAFQWACDDSGVPVKITSTGFQSGKTLKSFINSTPAWKSMNLFIQVSGTTVLQSAATPWWSNSVSGITPGGAAQILNTAGTIYVIGSTGSDMYYSITADKVSVITANGVTVSPTSASNTCNEISGGLGSPNLSGLICFSGRKFLWFEVNMNLNANANSAGVVGGSSSSWIQMRNSSISNGATATGGMLIVLTDSKNIYMNNITLDQSIWGMKLNNVDSSSFNNINITKLTLAAAAGILLINGSENNRFDMIAVANSAATGIRVDSSNNNMFSNTRINNIKKYGYNIGLSGASAYNTIFKSLITNIGDATNGEAIHLDALASHTRLSHITADSTYWNSVYSLGATYTLVHQFFSIASEKALEFATGSSAQVFQLASLNNLTSSIKRDSGVSTTVGGVFVRDNTSCDNVGTNDCPTFNASSVQVSNLTNAAFIGALTNGSDASNTHNVALSSKTATTITDWLNFSNLFRAWTILGGSSPTDSGNAYRISCFSGNCSAFDFRLANSNSVIRNKSGNGSTNNTLFVVGSTCPAAIDGNQTGSYDGLTFLLNAAEILDDGLGNDNGLCEQGETCTYSPHFGAYQGESTLSGACVFSAGGTITNATIQAYSVNGGM
ncbi:MAG: hypothetical protein ACOYOK_01615 [Pseudobdellovibrionaceae bacterium]